MTLSQQAKQAKATKKAQKRKTKLKQKSQQSNIINSIDVLKAGTIHECFVSEPQGTNPFYSVLISRINNSKNKILVAHFLIDPVDNGVEDIILAYKTNTSFQTLMETLASEQGFTLKSTSPSIAKKFILSAVKHAKSLGYMPHPDYHTAKTIFFDVDENLYSNVTFQFGE